jgi:hypothetical protein
MQVIDFPNTIVAKLNEEDSQCFQLFSIVPNFSGNRVPKLLVEFRNNPRQYVFDFDSTQTAEELYDDIESDSVDSYGRLFWRLKRSGKVIPNE